MSSLLDQSALTDLAERLVAAARRAGADAADALALRSVSLAIEVREGAVEESERSEGDDVGLRAFVGRRQAVVSTNDIKTDATDLAERAVAMAKAAPEDPFAVLADREQLARELPDLDLLDPDLPTVGALEERARRAESAALAVEGVTKSAGASASAGIGGIVLVTSHGFRGAYLNSGQSISMTAVAGAGTAKERGYDYCAPVPPGHAQRAVSSTPAPGPSNLHLAAGSDTPEALMADIAEGFYVTDLIGVGVNYVTGDYSRGANGFWIENGKRSYPVSEVTIAGSLLDMFEALVPANDLEFRFGTNAPTVRVEGLTVGGR